MRNILHPFRLSAVLLCVACGEGFYECRPDQIYRADQCETCPNNEVPNAARNQCVSTLTAEKCKAENKILKDRICQKCFYAEVPNDDGTKCVSTVEAAECKTQGKVLKYGQCEFCRDYKVPNDDGTECVSPTGKYCKARGEVLLKDDPFIGSLRCRECYDSSKVPNDDGTECVEKPELVSCTYEATAESRKSCREISNVSGGSYDPSSYDCGDGIRGESCSLNDAIATCTQTILDTKVVFFSYPSPALDLQSALERSRQACASIDGSFVELG